MIPLLILASASWMAFEWVLLRWVFSSKGTALYDSSLLIRGYSRENDDLHPPISRLSPWTKTICIWLHRLQQESATCRSWTSQSRMSISDRTVEEHLEGSFAVTNSNSLRPRVALKLILLRGNTKLYIYITSITNINVNIIILDSFLTWRLTFLWRWYWVDDEERGLVVDYQEDLCPVGYGSNGRCSYIWHQCCVLGGRRSFEWWASF